MADGCHIEKSKNVVLTPLLGNKIFKIFSHMCNICNTYPEKAVTALGRVISGYTAT